jgi:hypothetical protein
MKIREKYERIFYRCGSSSCIRKYSFLFLFFFFVYIERVVNAVQVRRRVQNYSKGKKAESQTDVCVQFQNYVKKVEQSWV